MLKKKKIRNHYLKLLIPIFFNFLTASVSMEIQNVDTLAGTLDIYMENQSSCSYCEDWIYNNTTQNWVDQKFNCEVYGGDAMWIVDAEMTEAECGDVPDILGGGVPGAGSGGWWLYGRGCVIRF